MKFTFFISFLVLFCYDSFCQKVVLSSQYDQKKYLGTWNGIIQRYSKDSSKVYATALSMIIYEIDNAKHLVKMTQFISKEKNKVDTVTSSIRGVAYEDALGLEFIEKDKNGNDCNVVLQMNYNESNGQKFLLGNFLSKSAECKSMTVSFVKLNDRKTAVSPIVNIKQSPKTATFNGNIITGIIKPGIYTASDTIKVLNEIENFVLTIISVSASTIEFKYKANQAECNIQFKGYLKKGLNDEFIYRSNKNENVFKLLSKGNDVKIQVLKRADDECAYSPKFGIYKNAVN